MAPMVTMIEIDRPPDEVYALATDPCRFPEWQNDVLSVRVEEGTPPAVGTRFTTIRYTGGAERSMLQEVTENVPARSWEVRGVDGPIRPTARIDIASSDGGAKSQVTFSLDFEGHGIGVPLLPIVRRQAQKGAPASYRRLKRLLETG